MGERLTSRLRDRRPTYATVHSGNPEQGECYCGKIWIFQTKLRQLDKKNVLKLAFCTKFYFIFAVLKTFNLVIIVTENVLVPTEGFQNTSLVSHLSYEKLHLPFFILVEDIVTPHVKLVSQ